MLLGLSNRGSGKGEVQGNPCTPTRQPGPICPHPHPPQPPAAAEVEVSVDNETSPSHTMLTLRCRDRKGLLYDLFRSLKDLELR